RKARLLEEPPALDRSARHSERDRQRLELDPPLQLVQMPHPDDETEDDRAHRDGLERRERQSRRRARLESLRDECREDGHERRYESPGDEARLVALEVGAKLRHAIPPERR